MYESVFYPPLPAEDAGGTRPAPQPLTAADVIRMRQERRAQIPAIVPIQTDKKGRPVLSPTGAAVVSFEPDPAPPPVVERPSGRSTGEALSDAGVALMSGFAGLVEQAGTLFGLISGDMDNAVRRVGKSSRDYWDDLKSPFLKGEEKRRFEEIEKADSLLAKAWVAAKVTATSPALMSSFIPEQAAQLLPSMGGAALGVRGAQLAGLGARATGAVGVGTAVGAGAVQQGADVGGDAFDELMAPALAGKWSESADYRKLVDAGATDAEARVAVALKEARVAAAKGGAATVATSVIPGGLAIERLLARVPAAGRSRVVNALKALAGEATQEGAEEGIGRVAVNQAVQAVDPARSIEAGVGEAIGLGALMGGAFGGVAGALQAPRGVTERAADAIAGTAPPAGATGAPQTKPGTALVTTPAQVISGGQPLGLPYEQVAQPIPGTGGPIPAAPESLPAPAATPMLAAPPKLLEWMTPTVIPPESRPGAPPVDVVAGGMRVGQAGDVSRETLSEQSAAAAARARAERLGETPLRVPAKRPSTTGPLDARAPQKPAGAQWPPAPPAPVVERTEITAAEGRPFKTAAAALRRRTTERLGQEWAPEPVDGGFVLRKSRPAAAGILPTSPSTDGVVPAAAGRPVVDKTEHLQNRDRGGAESIRQMQSIAADPDPARLSFSRTLADGAPVVFSNEDAAEIPAGQLGKKDVAVDAAGNRIEVQYAVLPAGKIVASHRADGTRVPEFESDERGLIRAVNNGRVAGLQRAFELGTAEKYVSGIAADEDLTGVGHEAIKGVDRPVLVRIMRHADVTKDIAARSNTRAQIGLSVIEQARTDSRRVQPESFEFLADGRPTDATLNQFVEAMPATERSELRGADGRPNVKAEDRLLASLFWIGYGDEGLLRLAAEARDPEAKSVISALARAAGDMAKLAGAGDMDIRPIVVDAARFAVNMARQGVPMAQAAAQIDITTAPEAAAVIGFIVEHARSSKAIAEGLQSLAQLAYAESQAGAADMFGERVRRSAAGIIHEGFGREGENPDAIRAQSLGEQAGSVSPEELAARQPGEAGRPAEPAAADGQAGEGAGTVGGADLFGGTGETDAQRALRDERRRLDQQQKQREAVAPPAGDFLLAGSDRPADQAEARGQRSLLDQEATEAAESKNEGIPLQKALRMTYDQAVAANMQHMGTSLSEWSAVEVSGTENVELPSGQTRAIPTFKFPQGYSSAPSLFKNSGAADAMNCELCSTPIKFAYWIKNDSKRWTMLVGSECVTHFGEGKSGEELTKEAKQQIDRQLLDDAQQSKRALHKHYTYRGHIGYGRYETTWVTGNDGYEARQVWTELKKLIGDRMNAVKRSVIDFEASSDAAVTRWANKNRDAASELIRKARLLIEKKEGPKEAVAPAVETRQEAPTDAAGPQAPATERGMTAAEREQNRIDGHAEELALQIANESHERDFSSYEAAKAVELWAAERNLDLGAFRDAVLKRLRKKGGDLAYARRTLERIEAITPKPAERKPLYASRPVANPQAIIDWARSQGFATTLPADDLHVTVAYSREAVDAGKVPAAAAAVTAEGGRRSVEPLGDEGAVVLKFGSPELRARWQQYRDAGASWDYDAYTPHITITYDAAGLDLTKVKPYSGPIELGPERQESLNVDKADDYKAAGEVPTKAETDVGEDQQRGTGTATDRPHKPIEEGSTPSSATSVQPSTQAPSGGQSPALPANLSEYSVTVPAADPKTGAMGTTTEKADAALARVDDQLTKARALLECLLH